MTSGPRAGRPRLHGLTSIRFFAALHVVLFHVVEYIPGFASWPRPLRNLLDSGYTAVSLFFILSGFILTYQYVVPGTAKRIDRLGFLSARVARIYPLYLLGLISFAPFTLPVARTFLSFLASATMVQSLLPDYVYDWNGPGWSISSEFLFYLIFPWFADRLARRFRPRRLCGGMALLWGASLLLATLYLVLDPDHTGVSSPHVDGYWIRLVKFAPFFRLPEFLLGALLGRLFLEDQAQGRRRNGPFLAGLAAMLILIALALSDALPYPLLHNGLLAPLFALLIFGVAHARGGGRSLLSSAPLVLLGNASYGVYILQRPVRGWSQIVFGTTETTVAMAAVYVVALVAISIVAYWLIETPARRYLRPALISWCSSIAAARLRALRAASVILLCLYGFVLATPPLWDGDVFFHLRVGEWLATHRALPMTDLFSALAPEAPWYSTSWFFDLLLYGAHRLAGLHGVRILLGLIVVAGYLLWLRFFRRQLTSFSLALALSMLLVALFNHQIRGRPSVVDLMAAALLADGLMRWPELIARRRSRIALFVLLALWANLNSAGALVGLGALAITTCVQVGRARAVLDKLARSLLPLGWGVVALATTPYGPALFLTAKENLYPLRTTSGAFQLVVSHLGRGLSAHNLMAALLPCAVLLALLVIAKAARKQQASAGDLLERLAAAAPLLYFLALSMTVKFGYLVVAPMTLMVRAVDWTKRSVLAFGLGAAATIGCFAVSYQDTVVERFGGAEAVLQNITRDLKADHYPESAAFVIRQAALEGRVFAAANWGGYLLWFGRPKAGVVSDARYQLSPSARALAREVELGAHADGARIDRALSVAGIDVAVLRTGSFPFGEWPSSWVRVAHDGVSETFLRAHSPERAKLAAVVGAGADDRLQTAATHFFGERYWNAHAARISALLETGGHAAVHELADLERIGDRLASAADRLRNHLLAMPSCIAAATELARIEHDLGRPDLGYRTLTRATGFTKATAGAQAWLGHLRTHVRNTGGRAP